MKYLKKLKIIDIPNFPLFEFFFLKFVFKKFILYFSLSSLEFKNSCMLNSGPESGGGMGPINNNFSNSVFILKI